MLAVQDCAGGQHVLGMEEEIADVEADNRVEPRKVRAQADADWTAAKQRFGDDLVA